jgi:anti-anti-sigma regulatory factor
MWKLKLSEEIDFMQDHVPGLVILVLLQAVRAINVDSIITVTQPPAKQATEQCGLVGLDE